MMDKYSIHIGLNRVSANAYNGWTGNLQGCVNDALAMEVLCQKAGFHTRHFLDENAKYDTIKSHIGEFTHSAVAGDIVVITNSSHGGQVHDANGDEQDALDETLCWYDGQVTDDAFREMLAGFAPGVLVVVVSDSCHSGTIARELEGFRVKAAPRLVTDRAPVVRAVPTKVDAWLLVLSGCADDKVSLDGASNGWFTENLIKAIQSPTVPHTWAGIFKEAKRLMGRQQVPQMGQYGKVKKLLTNQQIPL